VICRGKEIFTTFAMADRVAKLRRRAGVKRVAYRCEECKGFHVGSTMQPRRRGKNYFLVLA